MEEEKVVLFKDMRIVLEEKVVLFKDMRIVLDGNISEKDLLTFLMNNNEGIRVRVRINDETFKISDMIVVEYGQEICGRYITFECRKENKEKDE